MSITRSSGASQFAPSLRSNSGGIFFHKKRLRKCSPYHADGNLPSVGSTGPVRGGFDQEFGTVSLPMPRSSSEAAAARLR